MKKIFYPANSRGKATGNGKTTRYSFMDENFTDPEQTSFGTLWSFNEHGLSPQKEYNSSEEKDFFKLLLLLTGSIHYRDYKVQKIELNEGESLLINPTAKIDYSLQNPETEKEAHYLKIRIKSGKLNATPELQKSSFKEKTEINKFTDLIPAFSESGNSRPLKDLPARFCFGSFEGDTETDYQLSGDSRGLYVFLLEGEAIIEGQNLKFRDAMGIRETTEIHCVFAKPSQILLIEVSLDKTHQQHGK